MDLGSGGGHLPASQVIRGGAAEGIPGNGQRIGTSVVTMVSARVTRT